MRAESMLSKAMEHAEYTLRQNALQKIVAQLSIDFLDPGWQDVEQMAGQLGHLSLTALDLWRCFARSSHGMAALAFRLGSMPRDFFIRFDRELPFSWEIVPYSVWERVMSTLQTQCISSFGDQLGRKVLLQHIKDVSGKLIDDHPGLQFMLGLAGGVCNPEAQQERVALQFAVGPQAAAELFEGESCHLQKLLRNHANDQWPRTDMDIVTKASHHPLYSSYLCPQSFGFHDLIINLPILLAVQCADGTSGEWLQNSGRIGTLRTCQAFDYDWFSVAYNLTIARCLADGLMDQAATE
jgi:hypothetical protein